MEYLDHAFDVARGSARRPTPIEYVHVRNYPALDQKYVNVSTVTQTHNVESILEQVSSLYVSNEIKYVIAHLLGLYQGRFETLESDVQGALNVYIKDIDGAATLAMTLGAGALDIGNVHVQGTAQTMLRAEIDFNTAATHAVIAAVAAKKHKITTIVLVVGGQTNLTLKAGGTDISGPMDFGGTNEPRGMVTNHGAFPLECGTNTAFNIVSSGAVQLSGYVLYYDEA